MKIGRAIAEILVHGVDDWIFFSTVASCVAQATGQARLRGASVDAALDVVWFLIAGGFARAGNMTFDKEITPDGVVKIANLKFCPIEGSPDQVVSEIHRRLISLGRDPEMGEVCSFESTPLGKTVAKELLSNYPGRGEFLPWPSL